MRLKWIFIKMINYSFKIFFIYSTPAGGPLRGPAGPLPPPQPPLDWRYGGEGTKFNIILTLFTYQACAKVIFNLF